MAAAQDQCDSITVRDSITAMRRMDAALADRARMGARASCWVELVPAAAAAGGFEIAVRIVRYDLT